MYEDKTLICKECGAEFIFTAGEQEFYAEKGFVNEPQRCKSCREAGSGDARRHLRQLRQRGEGSLQAPRGSACVLQRVLRQHARRRLSAASVNPKSRPFFGTGGFFCPGGLLAIARRFVQKMRGERRTRMVYCHL